VAASTPRTASALRQTQECALTQSRQQNALAAPSDAYSANGRQVLADGGAEQFGNAQYTNRPGSLFYQTTVPTSLP
jgi:hypothetical protein